MSDSTHSHAHGDLLIISAKSQQVASVLKVPTSVAKNRQMQLSIDPYQTVTCSSNATTSKIGACKHLGAPREASAIHDLAHAI